MPFRKTMLLFMVWAEKEKKQTRGYRALQAHSGLTVTHLAEGQPHDVVALDCSDDQPA